LKLPYVLGFTFPRIDPYFLDRIEVYYGPASVLYGQAIPGGLINLVSKRPTAYSFYHFQFQTGYYGLAQGAFDIGGPIDKDGQFLFRLTGLARETETQVKHTQNERLAIAPALTWQPGPDTTLTVLGSYLYDPREFGFNELPLEGTAFPNPNGKIPSTFYSGDADFDRFKRSQYYVGYMFEQRLGDRVVLSQNFRFMHQNVYYNLVWPLGFEPDLRTMDRIAQKTRENLDVLTIDNHAQVKLNTGPVKHTLLAGLDYQYFWWNQRFGDTEGPSLDYLDPDYFQPIPDFPFASKARQKQDQLGLYMQDQAQFGDLFLLLGGRYDWADTKTRSQDLIDDTVANEKQDDHAFTWRAGAVYVLNVGLAPYFSYSESFLPTAGTDFSGNPFKPTRGKQYEAGIKYQPEWFNGFFTAAVYDLTETNVLTADPENPFFNIQTGEIRSRGVELSGVASPVKGLDVTAAYSYLDNKVTKADDGTQGKHPVGIPDNTASVWANYMFPCGYLAGFGVGGGVRYYGSSWGDSFNTFKIPGATIVDAVAQYDFGALFPNLKGLSLAVNASNLFDKHYLAFCQDFGCYYGLNRNVQVGINYNW
ncbi:MAG TPA: TonB-dependent siderophore receptor, partial [Thermodesulfobacteriota bacterium]|nr:TonB-dependent siderophore receptor [Thermodesulfobacteriota bacterium]